jgi:hypothetical protein
VACRPIARQRRRDKQLYSNSVYGSVAKYYCQRSTNSLILFGIRKNCLINGRSQLLYQFTKKGDKTDCNNYCGISLLSTSYNILSNTLLSRLVPYIDKIIGDLQCGFRRNRFSAFVRYWRKDGGTMIQYISYS